ncbi:MAG: hypothetical protein CUN57_01985, partial [Phototrophicales bacterium]
MQLLRRGGYQGNLVGGQGDETFGALITANRQFLIVGKITGFDVGFVNSATGALARFGPLPMGLSAVAIGQPQGQVTSDLNLDSISRSVAKVFKVSVTFIQTRVRTHYSHHMT